MVPILHCNVNLHLERPQCLFNCVHDIFVPHSILTLSLKDFVAKHPKYLQLGHDQTP